jgi:glycosyltransferase involved in cell wall biosynthesis
LFKDSSRRFAPPLPDPQSVAELRTIVRTEKPDIVHAHNWLIHSYLPLSAKTGPKVVMTLHDYSKICAQKRLWRTDTLCAGPSLTKCLSCASHHYGPLKGVVTSLSLRMRQASLQNHIDLFIPVSNSVALGNRLDKEGLTYEVIPNFIPDDVEKRTDPAYPELKKLPEGPFILFAGDLSVDKGVRVLLAAYEKLKKPMPLVLIGKSADERGLRPVKGVRILERFPHSAMMEAWNRAAIAVVPSIWADPCPTVAMEAMAARCPVVAARSGGLTDIVEHGMSGLLVEPGDPAELASAIQILNDDSRLREEIGKRAAGAITAFKAASVLPRIEHVYEQLLNQPSVIRKEALI